MSRGKRRTVRQMQLAQRHRRTTRAGQAHGHTANRQWVKRIKHTPRGVGPSLRFRPAHPIRGNHAPCDCHAVWLKTENRKKSSRAARCRGSRPSGFNRRRDRDGTGRVRRTSGNRSAADRGRLMSGGGTSPRFAPFRVRSSPRSGRRGPNAANARQQIGAAVARRRAVLCVSPFVECSLGIQNFPRPKLLA